MALVSVLVTIAIFGLIVVVHEFGHFIVAKRNGILVEEFAVGMGPKIYGKVKGETLYSIRAFPVGGFCKMLSEEKEDAKGRSFGSKSVLQRMAVCVAGAVMNLVLAFVIIFFIASFGASEMPVVGIPTNTIDFVAEDTPASRAGLMFGDRIISYNGEEINNQADMNRAVRDFGTNQALIEIERNGERLNLEITPVVMGEGDNAFPRVGISLGSKIGVFERDNFNGAFDRAGFGETVASSFRATSLYTRLIIGSVIDLVTFNVSADDISGPIGVGQF
ncbi:MAG: site-2 protease family protein, partial [Defluviitaleaceae bacterium]|nr:site-2 protease family protein [Defluviitaleaceae bacterium]